MRSINTSIVALLPVASLLFVGTYVFGGLALRDFALALFVGLLTGAYSSIFVATPDPGVAQGARAQVPRAARARGRRSGQGRGRRAGAARRRRRRRPTCPSTARTSTRSTTTSTTSTPRTARTSRHRAGSAAPAPATPSAAPRPATAASRGAANPRGRQQRGRRSAAEPPRAATGPGNTRPAGRVVAQMSTTDLSGSGPASRSAPTVAPCCPGGGPTPSTPSSPRSSTPTASGTAAATRR